MTVASTDSGGGAGVMADLKTMTALKVFGTAVIVSLTAQNSVSVRSIYELPEQFIRDQFYEILSDIGTDAAKTGMLFSENIINTVYDEMKSYNVKNIVIDPVMVSKTGARLLKEDAIKALVNKLMKIATLVTPNIPEAEVITGMRISDLNDMKNAALKIYNMTGASVLIKGGHMESSVSEDVLYNGEFSFYSDKRINTKNTHGTGDTLSSAIASYLAMGKTLEDSISMAKDYIEGAIINSFPMGRGYGPLNHFWRIP
ncbi:bifunctional hydroxymethylpyrimidine kinase/phosphomethylpyrimidine kinase [Picrophilus oshimae]|uniref:Phosphomethylpyrimidine kinase/hydroxymethylpyrimidine kinase n=1 Tax=Picrophilus torridus (strain ATCC 700027 / DSM 9790 / JCM 10055 / NBRC 100828 / KAW 2/3) TaxID=1122961 RepID=Q6KZH7_PICTO|nr:bifunctional hydroxymethylpyrimidine kinase/phosphomethylpyrimidine kinase [Picrophilus oshimae]AAT43875.1 phosphomethylpyrimidine kinase/hydroxymethylpyrimidine kinase [Picrophilus oshimae DSM 9789]